MAVEEVGDRWSLLILREAFYGVMRYDDIRADLGIPRSMLSDRLAKLVACGCLEKRPYQEAGDRRRYAYGLTDKGRGLAIALVALTQWSEAHILNAPGPVDIRDPASGEPVKAALVNARGHVVDRAEVVIRPRL
ncbi:MAG: winged helix-turn-helix transcriptional regulator [Maricaulaceae bacterium]